MRIEEKDFALEYDDGCNRFDLYLLYVINAKSEEKRREEFKIYGHSMTLDSALSVVINLRLKNKFPVLSLKEYLKEYRSSVKELKETLKL